MFYSLYFFFFFFWVEELEVVVVVVGGSTSCHFLMHIITGTCAAVAAGRNRLFPIE